jgi:hypothetical protein
MSVLVLAFYPASSPSAVFLKQPKCLRHYALLVSQDFFMGVVVEVEVFIAMHTTIQYGALLYLQLATGHTSGNPCAFAERNFAGSDNITNDLSKDNSVSALDIALYYCRFRNLQILARKLSNAQAMELNI